MKIGYGRVSTRDQHPEAQDDALRGAGCSEVFIDKASDKLARRPELDNALHTEREGDQLVITKLDRVGRSLEHLIDLSQQLQQRGIDLVVLDQGIDTSTAVGRKLFQIFESIAEFEHALMSERTRDGLAAARARGRSAARNPNCAPARSRSRERCTTNSTRTGTTAGPSPKSPPSSTTAGPPSTATLIDRPRNQGLPMNSIRLNGASPH